MADGRWQIGGGFVNWKLLLPICGVLLVMLPVAWDVVRTQVARRRERNRRRAYVASGFAALRRDKRGVARREPYEEHLTSDNEAQREAHRRKGPASAGEGGTTKQ